MIEITSTTYAFTLSTGNEAHVSLSHNPAPEGMRVCITVSFYRSPTDEEGQFMDQFVRKWLSPGGPPVLVQDVSSAEQMNESRRRFLKNGELPAPDLTPKA